MGIRNSISYNDRFYDKDYNNIVHFVSSIYSILSSLSLLFFTGIFTGVYVCNYNEYFMFFGPIIFNITANMCSTSVTERGWVTKYVSPVCLGLTSSVLVNYFNIADMPTVAVWGSSLFVVFKITSLVVNRCYYFNMVRTRGEIITLLTTTLYLLGLYIYDESLNVSIGKLWVTVLLLNYSVYQNLFMTYEIAEACNYYQPIVIDAIYILLNTVCVIPKYIYNYIDRYMWVKMNKLL
jgi:hypothetical protein